AVGENEGGNPDRAAPQDPLHALEIQRRALLAPQPYDVDREEGHRIAAQYCALGDDLGLYAEYASEAEQLQYGEHRAQSDGRDFHAAKTLFTGRVRKAKREYQEAGIAGALRHRLQQFLDEKDRRVVLQMGVEHEILAGIEPHHVEEEAGRHRTRLCPGELERAPDDEDSDDLVQCEEKLAGPVLWRHGGRADRHRDRRGLRLVVPHDGQRDCRPDGDKIETAHAAEHREHVLARPARRAPAWRAFDCDHVAAVAASDAGPGGGRVVVDLVDFSAVVGIEAQRAERLEKAIDIGCDDQHRPDEPQAQQQLLPWAKPARSAAAHPPPRLASSRSIRGKASIQEYLLLEDYADRGACLATSRRLRRAAAPPRSDASRHRSAAFHP